MESTTTITIPSLDEIYQKYHSVLCFFAYKFTRSYQEAEDIVHSVFEKIIDKSPEIQNEGALKSYLFSSVHNACLNTISKAGVRKKYTDYTTIHESGIDNSSYLIERVEAEILWEVFSKVDALPSECKKVFRMSYIEDMSNQEIADKLGISVNTVKSQKARAKQLLRDSLKELFVLAMAIIKYYN